MDKQRAKQLVEIGCIVCIIHEKVRTEACIHHLTGIKYRGTGKKASDEHTLPLCHNHHQGKDGIHTIGMRPWEGKYGTQTELLAITNNLIGMDYRSRNAAIHGITDDETTLAA